MRARPFSALIRSRGNFTEHPHYRQDKRRIPVRGPVSGPAGPETGPSVYQLGIPEVWYLTAWWKARVYHGTRSIPLIWLVFDIRVRTLWCIKVSVGLTGQVHLLGIEGLFTQESRRGRSSGYLVGGIFALDGSDWSNALRYHNFDTKPDTEFKAPPRRRCAPWYAVVP